MRPGSSALEKQTCNQNDESKKHTDSNVHSDVSSNVRGAPDFRSFLRITTWTRWKRGLFLKKAMLACFELSVCTLIVRVLSSNLSECKLPLCPVTIARRDQTGCANLVCQTSNPVRIDMSAPTPTRSVLSRLPTRNKFHGISPRAIWLASLTAMGLSQFLLSAVLARDIVSADHSQYQIQSDPNSTLIAPVAVDQIGLPGPLPDSQSLSEFYWEHLRAMLISYAASQASSAEIDKIVSDFKRKFTPHACVLASPRWHEDLQVLQASLQCTLVEPSSAGGQPAISQKEAVDVFMERDVSGWHLILEASDDVACAQARSKGTYQIWVNYLKRYPDGKCRVTAVERTTPAAEPVKVIRAEANFRFSPDGSRLYSTGSLNGKGLRVIVRDGKGELLGSQDLDSTEQPDSATVSSDGRYVMTLNRKNLTLHDLNTSTTLTLDPGELPISARTRQIAIDSKRGQAVFVSLSDDDRITRASRGRIYVSSFTLDKGKPNRPITMDIDPEVMLLSPDGSKLLIMGDDRSKKAYFVATYDTLNGRMLWKESISYDDFERPVNAAWSSQGELVSFNTRNTTEVRQARTGQKITLPKRGNRLSSLDLVFADDGKRFLMLEPLYKWITLYDVTSDKNIFRYDYGRGDVKERSDQSAAHAIFSPTSESGKFLVQEDDKATLFQINETGVKRVIQDGMP